MARAKCLSPTSGVGGGQANTSQVHILNVLKRDLHHAPNRVGPWIIGIARPTTPLLLPWRVARWDQMDFSNVETPCLPVRSTNCKSSASSGPVPTYTRNR